MGKCNAMQIIAEKKVVKGHKKRSVVNRLTTPKTHSDLPHIYTCLLSPRMFSAVKESDNMISWQCEFATKKISSLYPEPNNLHTNFHPQYPNASVAGKVPFYGMDLFLFKILLSAHDMNHGSLNLFLSPWHSSSVSCMCSSSFPHPFNVGNLEHPLFNLFTSHSGYFP